MATVAVFIALGGGAYAVSKNSVDSKAIKNGAVRSQEIKDDDVRAKDIESGAVQDSEVADGSLGSVDVADGSLGSADIADDSLSGADIAGGSIASAEIAAGGVNGSDIADDSLDADDIDEEDFFFGNLNVAGVLSSQARGIGGPGTTFYGPISGRAAADLDPDEVLTAMPPALFGNLSVFLPADLTAGQSRTFTVVLLNGPGGAETETAISCTVVASQDSCFDFSGQEATAVTVAAIKIENSGAGLAAGDDAYIGLAAKSSLGAGPLGP